MVNFFEWILSDAVLLEGNVFFPLSTCACVFVIFWYLFQYNGVPVMHGMAFSISVIVGWHLSSVYLFDFSKHLSMMGFDVFSTIVRLLTLASCVFVWNVKSECFLSTLTLATGRHWTGDIGDTDINAGQEASEGHSSSRIPLDISQYSC